MCQSNTRQECMKHANDLFVAILTITCSTLNFLVVAAHSLEMHQCSESSALHTWLWRSKYVFLAVPDFFRPFNPSMKPSSIALRPVTLRLRDKSVFSKKNIVVEKRVPWFHQNAIPWSKVFQCSTRLIGVLLFAKTVACLCCYFSFPLFHNKPTSMHLTVYWRQRRNTTRCNRVKMPVCTVWPNPHDAMDKASPKLFLIPFTIEKMSSLSPCFS